MSDPRTQLVAHGYDAMIDNWEAWVAQIEDDPRQEWTADLVARLPAGARVLELGCGGGTQETALLAQRFQLTGLDLSARQLERARERVPGASFVQGDLTELDFDDASFDAVVSYYVFNHVPRELLAPTLASVRRVLEPQGYLMAVFGTSDEAGWTGDFLGAPTFFSSWPPAQNSQLVRDAGFTALRDEVVTISEPEGDVQFQWVLAQR
jgi:ubiquinone/menaquinone biosynthesis C-methylase UbiE